MSAEWTPTTEQVRGAWAWTSGGDNPGAYEEAGADFDRWLTQYEGELRERIATDIKAQVPEMGRDINITDYRRGRWSGMTDAARIARGKDSR